jgi:ThiF family
MIQRNIDDIKKHISQLSFVKSVYFLEERDFFMYGKIEIAFEELEGSLDFEIQISPIYPLKSHDSESIRFLNKDLLPYDHVMGDGSICIHTAHSKDLYEKLEIDLNSLKNWIIKYYINKDSDLKYEHIIVPESPVNEAYQAYLFTDLNYEFNKGDFGEVIVSFLSLGGYKGMPLATCFIQSFKTLDGEINCQWSGFYTNIEAIQRGIFVFTEKVPAKFNRFAFNNWQNFDGLFDQRFLSYLHNLEKRDLSNQKGKNVPLFIGYKTVDNEIHWQAAILKIGNFPINGVPEIINGRKTGRWRTVLVDQKVSWALSRNSSYKYFFGRGTLSEKITSKKILLLGVGAVGSSVATTLVRGGCRFIDLVDYDVKEPENVCRSEYFFDLGINEKIQELSRILRSISPFVEISTFSHDYFEILTKGFSKEKEVKDALNARLNHYDIIIDCTTDNDLMYILNTLDLGCALINMSITNHAKELVCAFYPNIYSFVNNQFSNILKNDVEDLYNPTGCWSPTFKASYNDINVLVQIALKHINILFAREEPKNNFVIQTDDKNLLNIKIEEY